MRLRYDTFLFLAGAYPDSSKGTSALNACVFQVSGDVFLFVHPYEGSSELAWSWELPESREQEGRGRPMRCSVIFLCQFRNPAACGGRGLARAGLSAQGAASALQRFVSAASVGWSTPPSIFSRHIFPLGTSCRHGSPGVMSCQGQRESQYCCRLLTLWAWIPDPDDSPIPLANYPAVPMLTLGPHGDRM